MTYSEFGGRVAENASHGTDHGTAAPHLFMGGWVNGGLYGTASSLTDLRESDLKQTVDFRSLYARVIEKRWGGLRRADWPRAFTVARCAHSGCRA